MSSAYLAEFIGTAIFLTIILKAVATEGSNAKYVIVLGLLAAILLVGDISGGHFNPAVTFMQFAKGGISRGDAAGYVVAQLLGALLAVKLAAVKR